MNWRYRSGLSWDAERPTRIDYAPRNEKILEEVANGDLVEDVAYKYGLSRTRIYQIVSRSKQKTRASIQCTYRTAPHGRVLRCEALRLCRERCEKHQLPQLTRTG